MFFLVYSVSFTLSLCTLLLIKLDEIEKIFKNHHFIKVAIFHHFVSNLSKMKSFGAYLRV